MVTEMSCMTQILSKTADHKDQHNSAVQLSRYKEDIGVVPSHSALHVYI